MSDGIQPADAVHVSVAEALAAARGPGPVWTRTTTDLNVNLLSFDEGMGVPEHVNDEVDVLLVVVAGEGRAVVDGVEQHLAPGSICLIPKGSARSIHAAGGRIAYVSCHRRRGGLMPA
jgi:quercetin dioxygenase-like cupin family protein